MPWNSCLKSLTWVPTTSSLILGSINPTALPVNQTGDDDDSPSEAGIVLAVFVALLIAFLVVVVAYILWRRHTESKSSNAVELIHSTANYSEGPRPTSRSSSLSYFRGDAGGSPRGLQSRAKLAENELPPTAQDFLVSRSPFNVDKNRSQDYIGYDFNRVKLSTRKTTPGSEYINASKIDGALGTAGYIATEAPLANTVDTFWHIVMEQKCPVIVMLNNPSRESRDQAAYFPEEIGQRAVYGDMEITVKKQDTKPGFVTRLLSAKVTADPATLPSEFAGALTRCAILIMMRSAAADSL